MCAFNDTVTGCNRFAQRACYGNLMDHTIHSCCQSVYCPLSSIRKRTHLYQSVRINTPDTGSNGIPCSIDERLPLNESIATVTFISASSVIDLRLFFFENIYASIINCKIKKWICYLKYFYVIIFCTASDLKQYLFIDNKTAANGIKGGLFHGSGKLRNLYEL